MTRWEARLLLVNCSMCKHYMHSEQNDIDGLNCFADHHIAREQGNDWYGENAYSTKQKYAQYAFCGNKAQHIKDAISKCDMFNKVREPPFEIPVILAKQWKTGNAEKTLSIFLSGKKQ